MASVRSVPTQGAVSEVMYEVQKARGSWSFLSERSSSIHAESSSSWWPDDEDRPPDVR